MARAARLLAAMLALAATPPARAADARCATHRAAERDFDCGDRALVAVDLEALQFVCCEPTTPAAPVTLWESGNATDTDLLLCAPQQVLTRLEVDQDHADFTAHCATSATALRATARHHSGPGTAATAQSDDFEKSIETAIIFLVFVVLILVLYCLFGNTPLKLFD